METHSHVFTQNEVGVTYTLVPLGDAHLGARAADEEALRRNVEFIRDTPNCYWLGMGDYIDAITAQDGRRFDPTGYADWIPIEELWNAPTMQADRFLEITESIWDRCVGLLEGNHETALLKHNSWSAVHYMLARMQREKGIRIPYLGYSCLLQLKFRRKSGKTWKTLSKIVYAHHGHGGGRKSGSKINRLADARAAYSADIYLMGHVHDAVIAPKAHISLVDTRLGVKPRMREKTVLLGVCPAFLKTNQHGTTTYPEVAGYEPTWQGALKIRLTPFVSDRDDPKRSPNGCRMEIGTLDL